MNDFIFALGVFVLGVLLWFSMIVLADQSNPCSTFAPDENRQNVACHNKRMSYEL